jgi:predicted ATPase/DNA-binding SARP family transcriptional activator
MAASTDCLDAGGELVIRLFGGFEARLGADPLEGFYSRKGRWLLSLLTLNAGRAVDRAWIAGCLWPEAPEHQALYYLRRELTHLRAALKAQRRRLTSPTARTLSFDLNGADVDLLAFERAVAREDDASLEEAVRLHRGPLLAGCVEEWVYRERECRQQAFLHAEERLAERAMGRRDFEASIRHLRSLIIADPLREGAYRRLMQALAAQGDFAAVTQIYRELRQILWLELSAEPSPETAAVFQMVRHQARKNGREGRAASALSTAGPCTRIPHPLTTLIGRQVEIEQITSLLARARLITLTGIGGVGKTRIAIEAGRQLVERFVHGVCFVELAGLTDPGLLPRALLAALDIPERRGRDARAALAGALRQRHLLLVLDNCEHLIDDVAELCESMLHDCEHLRILATSRQPLKIMGEVAWSVPPLATPPRLERATPGVSDPARFLGYASVRLFIERARQSSGDFRLSPENVAAVAELCRRLDGIPLALELAASHARSLTPAEILKRLDLPSQITLEGSRTSQKRQQALDATMEWSYDLLNPREADLLDRLCVFAEGWTLEAMEEVASGEGIAREHLLRLLTQLVDKSLVIHETRARESRYRLLAPVRQFAEARLDPARRERLAYRHLGYFTRFCEAAEPHLRTEAQSEWLERLDSELGNLRAALTLSLAKDPGSALRLAGALWRYWDVRGAVVEGSQWLERALAAGAEAPLAPRAVAATALGMLTFYHGDYDLLRRRSEQSLTLAREAEDFRLESYSRGLLAVAAAIEGDLSGAADQAEAICASAGGAGDAWVLGLSHLLRGEIARLQGDYNSAFAAYSRALEAFETVGDQYYIAPCYANIGQVHQYLGRCVEASACFRQALQLSLRLRDNKGLAHGLEKLAAVRAQQGDLAAAARVLAAAEAFRESICCPIEPFDLPDLERAAAHIAGGLEAEALAAARAQGRLMSLDEAIAEALEEST